MFAQYLVHPPWVIVDEAPEEAFVFATAAEINQDLPEIPFDCVSSWY